MTWIPAPISARQAAAVGLASLAAAIGIGRFAFTPLLPLMQQAQGLTLAQGAWLASANYIGYLVGALAGFVLVPRPGAWARWGLVVVALSTLAMGVTTGLAPWIVLRFVAGIGSAFVLVGASSWALAQAQGRGAGGVFAGVGVGLVVAGLVALLAGLLGSDVGRVWMLLGALCAIVAAAAWRPLAVIAPEALEPPSPGAPQCSPIPSPISSPQAVAQRSSQPLLQPSPPSRNGLPPHALTRAEWTLVACYGVLGFGYILPATFIPAAARALVSDPLRFGLAWPLFGFAAAVSTLLVAAWFRATPPRRVAAASLVVMAAGVAVPLVHASLAALLVCALCVGGTFMVMTMAGAQEARHIAVGSPTRLIAAMTAAFALGQIAGPLCVGLGISQALASAIAVASMLASALVLLATGGPTSSSTTEVPTPSSRKEDSHGHPRVDSRV